MNRPLSPIFGMLMSAALMSGAYNQLPAPAQPSARSIRNNPKREKTDKDLARIEAARIKRERRKRNQGKI